MFKKLIKRLFDVRIEDKNGNARTWREDDETGYNTAGVRVNKTEAFGLTHFTAATTLISSTIGRTDLVLYERVGEGRERAINHPLYRLFKHAPNPWMTPMDFWPLMCVNCIWAGTAYAAIIRDDVGNPTMFIPINPQYVDVIMSQRLSTGNLLQGPQAADIQITYRVRFPNQETIYIDFFDMLTVKSPLSFDGFHGESLVNVAKRALGVAIATNEYGARYYSNGGNLSQIITLGPASADMNKEDLDHFVDSFNKRWRGMHNSNKVVALQYGSTFSRFSPSSSESDWLGTADWTGVNVANLFSLPSSFLNCRINTSYNALSQDQQSVLWRTFDPWFVAIEQMLFQKLLTKEEQDQYYFEFLREKLLETDITVKNTETIAQLQAGIITLNEARARFNMSELPTPAPTQADQKAQQKLYDAGVTNIERMKKRLLKDTNYSWEKHEKVLFDSFSCFDKDKVTYYLDKLKHELDAVLPEQRPGIIESIDSKQLARDLT